MGKRDEKTIGIVIRHTVICVCLTVAFMMMASVINPVIQIISLVIASVLFFTLSVYSLKRINDDLL